RPASGLPAAAATAGNLSTSAGSTPASTIAATQPINSGPAPGPTPAVTVASQPTGAPAGAVPLSAFTHLETVGAELSINRQGQFPAATISFNLAPRISLGQAVKKINDAAQDIKLPPSIVGSFQGTAQAFETSLTNEPLLILAALITVYIVLGVLYESYIH